MEHWRRAVRWTGAGIFAMALIGGLVGGLTRGSLADAKTTSSLRDCGPGDGSAPPPIGPADGLDVRQPRRFARAGDMQEEAGRTTTVGVVSFAGLPAGAAALHLTVCTVTIPIARGGRARTVTSSQVDFVSGALLHQLTFNGNAPLPGPAGGAAANDGGGPALSARPEGALR
jgi:hypothetical protein